MNPSSNLLQKPTFEFSLQVLSGEEKGTTYRLTGSQITIGRGQENDIQFSKDIKCSRKHAVIDFTDEGIFIENVSDSNIVLVDNIEIQKSRIKHGSRITIGQTEIQLQVKTESHLPSLSSPTASSATTANKTNVPPSMSSHFNRAKSSPPLTFILVGVALVIFYFIFLSPNKKKNDINLRTEEAIDAEIEKAQKLKEAVIDQRQKQGKNSQQYEDAQAAYLQGFRDYKQGNYGRALELFQACLSLLPEHSLCQRYLRLSQRKYNELIQYHMILGRKYREQSQYAACRASFRNVMVMVADTTSAIYKEAKANFDACDTLIEERY